MDKIWLAEKSEFAENTNTNSALSAYSAREKL